MSRERVPILRAFSPPPLEFWRDWRPRGGSELTSNRDVLWGMRCSGGPRLLGTPPHPTPPCKRGKPPKLQIRERGRQFSRRTYQCQRLSPCLVVVFPRKREPGGLNSCCWIPSRNRAALNHSWSSAGEVSLLWLQSLYCERRSRAGRVYSAPRSNAQICHGGLRENTLSYLKRQRLSIFIPLRGTK